VRPNQKEQKMTDYRTLFDLSGRTALVVGAGSGIGQASAAGLAAFGAHVICSDIRRESVEEVAEAIRKAGGSAEALEMDMRDTGSIRQAIAPIERIHILVSTPSINVRKPVLDITDEEFDRIVDLNLKGTFRLVREVARGMADQGGGSIIVFSSIRSQVVEPGQGVYAATKSGVVLLLRALAAELGPRGVRANAIAPGVVDTPLTRQIKNHPEWHRAYAEKSIFKRWAKPDEMVGAVLYLASDASSYTTGSVMFVDGGWTAVDGRFTPPTT
jgi:NAD(P)-dependent dehydrogenase (short-subunit alcohol dehydrogenase family)